MAYQDAGQLLAQLIQQSQPLQQNMTQQVQRPYSGRRGGNIFQNIWQDLSGQSFRNREESRVGEQISTLEELGVNTRQMPGLAQAMFENPGAATAEVMSRLTQEPGQMQPVGRQYDFGTGQMQTQFREKPQVPLNMVGQLAKGRAQAEARAVELQSKLRQQGFMSVADKTDFTTKLASDWQGDTENAREAMLSYEQAMNLLNIGDSLGATLAIVKLAKAADPGSVVRNEERVMVEGGTGLANLIATRWNAVQGEGFNAEAQEQFKNSLAALLVPVAQELKMQYEAYSNLAAGAQIDPESVFRGSYNPALVEKFMPIDLTQ